MLNEAYRWPAGFQRLGLGTAVLKSDPGRAHIMERLLNPPQRKRLSFFKSRISAIKKI